MADLPGDVITNIFSRLPVRSLLQFRSISKSCRFLIDSDHFKTLHFNNSQKSNSKLVLCDYYRLYAVDLPTLGNAVHLNKPLKFSETYYIRIIGSCNGLLLCINSNDIVMIWNPYLCKHWIIPRPPSISFLPNYHFLCVCVCVYGFGFDSFTGDYKLLKVTYFNREHDFVSKVSLFSCKTNTWKTLPNMPYALYGSTDMGVFVDHALHWVVTKTREYDCPKLIVAFDLRFEVFNEVPLPDLVVSFGIKVSQLRGCLSMVVDYYYYSRIDFWVMKQYGSKDGWFKLFTWVDCSELTRPLNFVNLLGYSSDGMKVLFQLDRNKLIWYNLKSKQVTHVTNLGMPNFYDAMIWVESFVEPPFPSENYRKQ